MNEELKKLSDGLVAEIRQWLEAPDIKAVIEETQKAADQDTGTFEVVITTENLDRYQEVIKLDGWELEHYRNNPVVLWGHDHKQLPIGVATSIEVKDGKMVAKGKFAPHPFAQTIRQLYDMGIMRATSVGFIEKEREGNLITKAELLEFSFVSVPANPFALSTLVKSGVSINEMVTKGILCPGEEKSVEEEISPESTETEPTPEEQPTGEPQEPDQPAPEPVVEEKQFSTKAIEPIISSLKGAIVALEALSQKELEGNEAPVEETEEEKQFREFSETRRSLQALATELGDALAEMRQAMEAKE